MSDNSTSTCRRLAAAGVAALAAAGAWAAWAGGFTPGGTQPPVTHPVASPEICSFCHADYDGTAHLEPWNTWAGSMMANATRDPLFWAALDVAENDVPGVGDFCLRCHAPTAWLGGRSEPPDGSTDGCGLIGNLDEPGEDFAGVSCHLCHRMMVNETPPMGEESVYYENATYWIDDTDCGGQFEPCRRGPYEYSGGGTPPPHPWAFSSYHVGADICGNCHNVTSPVHNLIDESGSDTGIRYPIERTFKEWQQSDYAPGEAAEQRCQDCHMPDTSADPAYACGQLSNDHTGDLAIHEFAGGNAWVPAVLKGTYPSLNRDESFDATIAAALDMLQNRSATVEVSAPVEAGGVLEVDVKVTNLTGHKLPTGYPEGRRMWLGITARDAGDNLLWQSGAYDGATGELTEDAQIKVYRAEPGIWNRNGTDQCDTTDGVGGHLFHFVLNNCWAVDNRIPPLGFTGKDDPETRPVGYVYPETSKGSGILVSYDVTSYRIPIPGGAASPITVEATLYFQTASAEYVEFLRDQAIDNGFPDDCLPRSTGNPTQSRGEILYDLWQLYDRSPPVAMDADSAAVPTSLLFYDGFESGDTSGW